MQNNENNSRIAKNTALLYVRMILTMGVSLFTVRVVLYTLGVVDYGIYSVVGGIVTMLSFLSNTMASASQRFFAFELGKNDIAQLKKTFSVSMLIYIGIAIIVLVLGETVGLWFLNTKMVIPSDRISAANWVFQFSLFSFVLRIIVIPYISALIARENMKVFAYISIFEVLLKLLIVYLLSLFTYDKLIVYAILLFLTTSLISFSYIHITKKKYPECVFKYYWNKSLFKSLTNYSLWNMVGALANTFKINGTNILLNVFFGPVVNAARGIAFQVFSALNSFIVNFYMAVRPQITKAYSAGDIGYMMGLVFSSAKISFFLLLILSMPLLIETDYILKLWLIEPPEGASIFIKLLIINTLIEVINNQLVAALQAAGKIKVYQSTISILLLLVLPISYLFLSRGAPPEYVFYVSIGISVLTFIPQLIIVKKIIGISLLSYWEKVIFVIIKVSFISYIIPILILTYFDSGLNRFMLITVAGVLSCFATVYYFGITDKEKLFFLEMIKSKFSNKKFQIKN